MISLAAKAARVFIPFLLLIVVGSELGRWLAVRHYRPLLDAAYAELANAKAARGNLETLAGEQGRKLGDLVLALVMSVQGEPIRLWRMPRSWPSLTMPLRTDCYRSGLGVTRLRPLPRSLIWS